MLQLTEEKRMELLVIGCINNHIKNIQMNPVRLSNLTLYKNRIETVME